MGATDLSVLPQRQILFPETIFKSSAATDVPLRVEGIISQSGNLQEWTNSEGSVLLRVDSSGMIKSNSRVDYTQQFLFGGSP